MASPDIRFPSIEGLRAFEAAARLGSFERAAEELNVTASAIGKRIAALEDLLGTPLFTRGPKALSLTATGKEYLAQVGAALGKVGPHRLVQFWQRDRFPIWQHLAQFTRTIPA